MLKLFRIMRDPGDAGAGAGSGGGAGGADDKTGQGAGSGGAGGAGAGDKGAQGGDKGAGSATTFTIPKEYAEKGWAKKVKSIDDVYKQLDNLDSVAGKKRVVPDLSKTDDPEVQEYITALRGDTKIEDYKFGENTPKEYGDRVAKILFDKGIPKSIGNAIIAEYQGLVKEQMEAQFSKEGYDKIVAGVFGENKQKAGEVVNIIAELLGPEGKAHLETKIPNGQVEFMYKFLSSVIDKYGIKDTGAGAGGGEGGGTGGDIEKTRSEIRAKMKKLTSGTHTQAEKDALQKQLDATYGIK